jgi:hypothetical protein
VSTNGGALSLEDESAILGVVDCSFQNCTSIVFGGAIYAAILSFALNSTTGLGCAAYSGGFCFIWILAPQEGSVQIADASAAACAMDFYCVFYGGQDPDDTTSLCSLAALNVSACDGVSGTALALFELSQCWIRYTTFADNSDGPCVYLVDDVFSHDITCVALCNNTALRAAESELVFVQSHLVLANCIFQANRYHYLLTTYLDTAVDVTLLRCIFDVPDVNYTRSVAFVLRDCSFDTLTMPAVAAGSCPWADPTNSPSPDPSSNNISADTSDGPSMDTNSDSPSMDTSSDSPSADSGSRTLLIVLGSVGAFLIVVVMVIVIMLIIRRCPQTSQHEAEKDTAYI